MARFILWSILLTLLLRSLSRLMHGILEGAGYTRDSTPQKSVGLVRDPVCGVFVVPGQALAVGDGSSRRYFCSEKCRREWKGR
jgi:YHS domain-containing protein